MSAEGQEQGGSAKLVIHMPAALKERLEQSAEKRGIGQRGLSADIRRRLETSLASEEYDVPTRYLGALILTLAQNVNQYFGHWSQKPFAQEVLRSSIERLFQTMQPAGELEPKLNPDSIAEVLFDPDDLEGITRTLVGIALTETPNIIKHNEGGGGE